PLLNDLGTNGFAKVREEAEKYGAVITGDAAKASEQFNDNLTRLKLETQGFANAVVQQLLPGLNQITNAMVEAGSTSDRYGQSATTVASAIKILVLGLISAKEMIASVATITFGLFDAIKTVFAASGQVIAAFAVSAYQQLKGAFTLDGAAIDASRQQLATKLAAIGNDVKKSFVVINSAVG